MGRDGILVARLKGGGSRLGTDEVCNYRVGAEAGHALGLHFTLFHTMM
jgi:hypothetical protein